MSQSAEEVEEMSLSDLYDDDSVVVFESGFPTFEERATARNNIAHLEEVSSRHHAVFAQYRVTSRLLETENRQLRAQSIELQETINTQAQGDPDRPR
jgi:hypothetical protein